MLAHYFCSWNCSSKDQMAQSECSQEGRESHQRCPETKQTNNFKNHIMQSGPVTGQMELWIVCFYQQNRGRKCFKMRLCYFPQFLLWNLPEMNFKSRQPLSWRWMQFGQQERCRKVAPLWKMWAGRGRDEEWIPVGGFGWVKNQALKHSCVC